MNAETARAFLLKLPHVVETQQWGDNIVFWVGDKTVGGRMFCLIDLGSGMAKGVVSFAAGPERAAELLELDGMIPAPYLARAHWVASERWNTLRNPEWEEVFTNAHARTLEKLAPKTKRALGLLPPLPAKKAAAKKAAAKKAMKKT